ncbi:DUF7524 family protein [Halorussus lipolyticus]|uniref:DUF7524 family protein n=1 Tax=Halorussus lipolyticus TaxID=3034024 RepID=UPI0023E7A59D|nr:hypothetical protein [Halorussus sp. DT80]
MPESLPVRLNSSGLHDIETSASFEATESFPILLHNGDAPVHVHLHLDDALSQVASIPANNHFVDADSTRQVSVEIADGPRPVEGQLKIVTGHGAETDYVSISVVEPDERADAVDVDASLADPASGTGPEIEDADDDEDADDESVGFDLPDRSLRTPSFGENAPVAVLGVLALAVAAGSATLSNSAVVLVGILILLGTVVAAGYMLVE